MFGVFGHIRRGNNAQYPCPFILSKPPTICCPELSDSNFPEKQFLNIWQFVSFKALYKFRFIDTVVNVKALYSLNVQNCRLRFILKTLSIIFTPFLILFVVLNWLFEPILSATRSLKICYRTFSKEQSTQAYR